MLTAKEELAHIVNYLPEEQAAIYLAAPDMIYLLQKWLEDNVCLAKVAPLTEIFLTGFNSADLESIVAHSVFSDTDFAGEEILADQLQWKKQIYG